MKQEITSKTNWKAFSKEDIQEIKNIIEYTRGLVIKDQMLADKYETMNSMRNGVLYVSAMQKLNDTEEMASHIIKTYKETNKYYLYLKENYNISYYDARVANHYDILQRNNPVLERNDEILFNKCYNHSLLEYKKIFVTKAFNNQEYNSIYFKLMILNFTIQKYLSYKLERYFDIDRYTEKELKNSFISYGFDYFDIIPINYKRRLLKLLNELVMSKGTNHDIKKLLDIFNFSNMTIFEYIIAKIHSQTSSPDSSGSVTETEPNVIFYKTPFMQPIDYQRDLMISYDAVTENDIYWKIEKEEVLYHRELIKETGEYRNIDERLFNTIISKYISVDYESDILKEGQKLSYFMSLLYLLEKEYPEKKGTDFSFTNRNISDTPIDLFTGITALISLMIRQYNLEDEINHFPNLNFNVYGYNNLNDNSDIQEILDEIKILLIQNKTELSWSKSFNTLYEYYKKFNLKGFEEPLQSYTIDNLYSEYNINNIIQNELHRMLLYSDDIALREYLSNENNDIIDRMNFIRNYFLRGKLSCKILYQFKELSNFFQYYLIVEGSRNKLIRIETNQIFNNSEELLDEINLVVNLINHEVIKKYYNEGDYFKVFDEAEKYNTARRKKLMEELNIKTEDELLIYIRKDKQDISYYKEFTAFFNLFYVPWKNINNDKKINIQDFLKIYKLNEEVRNNLEQSIGEIEIYQLYKRYLKIWDSKFLTKLDTSIYKDCTYFSDYCKNNLGLYNWIFPEKSSQINDKEEMKKFYQDRIFTLAENIDNYIGFSFFENFGFSGITDVIFKILYLVIMVFKAYTIDLADGGMIFYINDKNFNSIRLFDEINNEEEYGSITSKISLEDVTRDFIKDFEYENTIRDNLTDVVNISEYIDNTQPDKEITMDMSEYI